MLKPVPTVLALDAMGVIYRVGDDVADLLVPFIRGANGVTDQKEVEAAYTAASLGKINAEEFWRRVELSPELEDEYLKRIQLSDGLHDFLQTASTRFEQVICLSNDVSEWSRKLRKRFELDCPISRWYISGELGFRKPAPEIYRQMLTDLGIAPAQILFVDDRLKNLESAATLGIQTVHFDANRLEAGRGHRTISRLVELLGK